MTLDRIEFVTRHFYQLQGLRLVPIGSFLLFMAADAWGLLNVLPGKPTGPSGAGNVWSLIAWACAVAGGYAVVERYRTLYGSVVPKSRRRRNLLLTGSVLLFGIGVVADEFTDFAVLLGPAVVAATLASTVVFDGWVRAHYLLAAVLWLALSQWPSAGIEGTVTFGHYFLFGGLTLILCGVGDHLMLSKGLRELRQSLGKGEINGQDAVV